MQYILQPQEEERILAFKRDMHMHPELAHQEFRTTEKIKEFLSTIPSCSILPLPVKTGVLARIEGNREGKEVMLRADIDGLPQTEQYESPWKSLVPGVMHACGHDFHTAALLGAAILLDGAAARNELHGTVDLVFQPAEEGTTGARTLIDAGLFDLIHPDYCFGLHNWPSVKSGTIICHEGALMAAKRNFELCITGSGGHGSMPHLNRDPIVCAAAVVLSLQTVVSRNTNPLDSVVVSISQIEGGSPVNRVAEKVRMVGTVRSLSDDALDRAIERTEAIAKHTALAYECGAEIVWKERIPTVYNSSNMTEFAHRCASLTGCEVSDAKASLASEDFALYRSYVPSFFYWVGSSPSEEQAPDLHHPMFHTDDSMIPKAATLLAVSADCAGRM